MTATLMMLAAVAVFGPSGEKVCDVTLPALPQGARIETTNMENAVAWRIRFDGDGERLVADAGWVFDFGADLRCWPVSHAQGEYVPKTLSTISQMAPRPDFAPVAAGIGEMHNYATHFPGTAESPLVVEGPGFVAAIGDADPDDARSCAPVVVETRDASSLTVTCAANGGFAAIVEQKCDECP